MEFRNLILNARPLTLDFLQSRTCLPVLNDTMLTSASLRAVLKILTSSSDPFIPCDTYGRSAANGGLPYMPPEKSSMNSNVPKLTLAGVNKAGVPGGTTFVAVLLPDFTPFQLDELKLKAEIKKPIATKQPDLTIKLLLKNQTNK